MIRYETGQVWPARFFGPTELRCKHCGVLYYERQFLSDLDQFRLEWGRPLIVASGYRCLVYNTKVGGAAHSYHMYGRAADLGTGNLSASDLRRFLDLAHRCFGGVGIYSTFVHLDNGPIRSWHG